MQIALRVVAGAAGAPQGLQLDAPSEAAAVRLAVARGFRVMAVERLGVAEGPRADGRGFLLVQFSQELLALLDAGLTLVEAIDALIAKEMQPQPRALLEGIAAELREGKPLSDVLERRPAQFPDLYVATVRSAERSGNLAEALARYVAYRVQFESMRKKMITASIYPLMLMSVGLLVTLFLIGYVVPKFSAVYASSGRPVPWMSGLLLTVGRSIHQHWSLWFAALAAAAGAAVFALRDMRMRERILAVLLRIPVLSRRAWEFRLARFYRTLALLLNAGIPLARGMGMTAGLFPAGAAAALQRARRAIEEGQPFSRAVEEAGMGTAIALSLIRVGERSGKLAEMLERAARFHDEEFGRWVEWASRLLEPVLMTVMGLVIGGVVVLLYLPIFDLAGSLR